MIEKVWNKIVNKIRALLGIKVLVFDDTVELPPDADLEKALDAKAEGTGLKWRVSVVDFLKLLEIDSSRENRDELADELGVSAEYKSGSAEKNDALRKAVFQKLSESGGTIPPSLLD